MSRADGAGADADSRVGSQAEYKPKLHTGFNLPKFPDKARVKTEAPAAVPNSLVAPPEPATRTT